MGFISTNFNRDTKMVLTNDDSKVIAIINIPKGNDVDISDKIIQALKDEYSSENVSIKTSFELDMFSYETNIICLISDEDEIFQRCFNLVTTAEY